MEEDIWYCPHCGAELKTGAKVCHNCGSDEETGWSDMTYLDGADWIHEEWSPESESKEKKVNVGTIVLIVVIIVAVILSALR